MKKLSVLFLSFLSLLSVHAQVIITETPNPNQVTYALSGIDVNISNLEILSHDSAYGLIDAEFNPVFYGQGFALTNGNVKYINGPNNQASTGYDLSLPGDSDLNIIAGVETFDASLVEFDITTLTDTLFFYYFFEKRSREVFAKA